MGPVSPKSVARIQSQIQSTADEIPIHIYIQGGIVEETLMCSNVHPGLFPNSFNIQGSLYTWIHLEKMLDTLSIEPRAKRSAIGFRPDTNERIISEKKVQHEEAMLAHQELIAASGGGRPPPKPLVPLWDTEEEFNELYKDFLINGPGSGLWSAVRQSEKKRLNGALVVQDCSDKDNYTSLAWMCDTHCKISEEGEKEGEKMTVLLTGAERAGFGSMKYDTTLTHTKFVSSLLNFSTSYKNSNGYSVYWPEYKTPPYCSITPCSITPYEHPEEDVASKIEEGLVNCFIAILAKDNVMTSSQPSANLEYAGCALGGGAPGDIVLFNPLIHTDHLHLAHKSFASDTSDGDKLLEIAKKYN